MEEKESGFIIFPAKGEHSRLMPQKLCPHSLVNRETLYSQAGMCHRIKVVTVLYSFFCSFQNVGLLTSVHGPRWPIS